MKKKIISLTILAFLLGSAVTFAASNYYADLLAEQQEQIEQGIEEVYKARQDEISEQIHHDMVTVVETERQRVMNEAESYLKQKLSEEQQGRMNEHTAAIRAEADRIIEEIKIEIDQLFEE
ncbi:hypothetical protein [Oceanobacillus rekensis]|uniref:hypothetical protein n=1 Tax=Oceanobacillus rekensis TaxID=937927 RepID=UPI000B44899A|nr:hypothetical protein [Oceanobacillus rekensis]